MKPKRRKSPEPDAIPADYDAEAGAISCILLSDQDAARQMLEQLQELDFHDLRHVEVFRALVTLDFDDRRLDVPTLFQFGKDEKRLEAMGGMEYVTTTLPDAAPSAANFPSYLATLRDRTARRKMLLEAADLARQAHDLTAPVEIRQEEAPVKHLSFYKGLHYNTANDPNTILGMSGARTTRYLCRGKAWWIIAPSGIGKSVLLYQMACMFALGKPLFGITPPKAHRIVFVQGENDDGDLAEVIQGAYAGLGLNDFSPELETLNDNIRTISECRSTGQEFCRRLSKEIRRHKADIAMVDPMLSFAGIDVSRQDQCSMFLRTWLNPILEDTGAGLIATHHTGKPKLPKEMRGMTPLDLAYQGLGSSELVNWARAVSIIMPHGDDSYELKLLKRGNRAGATHPDGTPTTSVWLRHSFDKMWWEQIAPPEETPAQEPTEHKVGKPSRIQQIVGMNLFAFLNGCTKTGERKNEIAKRLEQWLSTVGEDVSIATCKRAIETLASNPCNKLKKTPESTYVKGPNA